MPELQPDDVIHVGPDDYAFGDGPLLLRVTAVGPHVRVGRPGVWREVEGIELDSRGWPRSNLVRLATVRLGGVRWRNERA